MLFKSLAPRSFLSPDIQCLATAAVLILGFQRSQHTLQRSGPKG